MEDGKQSLIYAAAMLHSLITGLSYLFSKMGLNLSNPWDLLAYRFYCFISGYLDPDPIQMDQTGPQQRKNKEYAAFGYLLSLVILYFQTFGLQYMTSSESGILLAMILSSR